MNTKIQNNKRMNATSLMVITKNGKIIRLKKISQEQIERNRPKAYQYRF